MVKPYILSIAASDPSGGAGLVADIEAITLCGGKACQAVTAITVQNTLGVYDTLPVSSKGVMSQIKAVKEEANIAAFKTGLLGSVGVIESVAEMACGPLKEIPFILDPVLSASSGKILMDEKMQNCLWQDLMPLATLVTPNAPEAEKLSGKAVADINGQRRAAEKFLEEGARAVLIKGGHCEDENIIDVLARPEGEVFYESERLSGGSQNSWRGTGCRLSAAIATHIGVGDELLQAIEQARDYLLEHLKTQSAQ